MGILRTDRVSGLGGANAIKGSVFFGSNDSYNYDKNLEITNTSDLDIGDGNYTIEYWFNCVDRTSDGFNTSIALSEYTDTSSNNAFSIYHYNTGFYIFNRTGGSFPNLVTNSDKWTPSKWHHFAWVRSGTGTNENVIYVDGASVGSFTNAVNYTSGQHWLIGANFYTGSDGYGKNPQYGWSGHLSNVRVSNVARYSGAFTPPKAEYVVDSNTILLACQSPSNILQEATGKEVNYFVGNAFGSSEGSGNYFLNSPPQASHFTPNSPVGFSTTSDVGTQFGSTFDGVTTFDSQAYMLPPGGNTRERNRGRGLILGGYSPNPAAHVSTIQSIEIHSFGNAQDFGDLTSIRSQIGGVSSKTRAISCGGGNDTPSDYTPVNICEFVTIATSSNTTDFGDLTVSRTPYKASSNDTRGIIFGGYAHPSNLNTIDFITIATTGNATDFGDEIDTNRAGASCSSTTRGIVAGGSPATNRISFVEIATTGNAQDFGDLLNSVVAPSGCSDKTRGVFAGGATPTAINVIQFITMSSAGDATDFGDLNTTEKVGSKGNSNSIRGIFSGGYDGGTFVNSISAITIATTGNAVDFGDISGTLRYAAGTSDSHGGLE